jgi:hypothetical protein
MTGLLILMSGRKQSLGDINDMASQNVPFPGQETDDNPQNIFYMYHKPLRRSTPLTPEAFYLRAGEDSPGNFP